MERFFHDVILTGKPIKHFYKNDEKDTYVLLENNLSHRRRTGHLTNIEQEHFIYGFLLVTFQERDMHRVQLEACDLFNLFFFSHYHSTLKLSG